MTKRAPQTQQLTLDGWLEAEATRTARGRPDPVIGDRLCGWLAEAMEQSGKDRFQLAADMTRITGEEIAKTSLDAWTATAKRKWRFPLSYLPALVEATGAYWLLDRVAETVGCKVLVAQEHVYYRLGKLQEERRRLEEQERYLSRLAPPRGTSEGGGGPA
jgi:hypothetical protein